jgi:uncharacterized protein YeaO (DUF488 family)
MKQGLAATTPVQWRAFQKTYRAEMAKSERRRELDLLAALSKRMNLSVGCYCADESRCHRSILRELLKEHGAKIASVR